MTNLTYLEISFDLDSAAAKDLFARLNEESTHSTIPLTPLYSSEALPPYFTPNMASWYKYFVQPYRTRLLNDVTEELQAQSGRRGQKPFILEIERDRIEMRKYDAIQTERDAFMLRKDAANIYAELSDKSDQYNLIKSDHGRDAKRWTPVLYWVVLFIFMVPEFMINWESFLKIPVLMNTPALVLGSVLLVAAFFAFSSDRIGMVLKQRQDRFGGGVSATERRKSHFELWLGLVLFLIGMGIVVWGRYMLITDIIREKSILKGEGFGSEEMLLFAGALLGNIGVWLAGVLWSFVKHDSVPEFSELQASVEKLRSEMSRIYNKHLTSRNQRHILAAQKLMEQLDKSDKAQQARATGSQDARQLFNSLRNKDDEALALLEEYRSRLVSKIKSQSRHVVFLIDDISKADLNIREEMLPDVYGSSSLQFRYA
jgi:hypothetical protein